MPRKEANKAKTNSLDLLEVTGLIDTFDSYLAFSKTTVYRSLHIRMRLATKSEFWMISRRKQSRPTPLFILHYCVLL